MAKDCPKCGLINPDDADVCDCGYQFSTGQVRTRGDGRALAEQKSILLWSFILGFFGLILGLIYAIAATRSPTTRQFHGKAIGYAIRRALLGIVVGVLVSLLAGAR